MKFRNIVRKMVSVLLISVLTASLSGCGNKQKSGAETDAAEGQTTADMADLPEVTWKISHTQAPDNLMNVVMENMAVYVSEHTDGKFNIEIYHSGTLGSEQEVIEGMQMGNIAGNLASVSLLANFVPSYNMFSLPGLFKDEDTVRSVLEDRDLMSLFTEQALEQGIIVAGSFQDYFRMVFSKEPIKEVEDFQGQKIRVMASPVLVDTFQQLGCNSTTTAWSELYSGLQLGVVDGLDHVATSVRTMNFYEHTKYMSDVKLFATPMFLIISQKMYEQLPDAYKEVLNDGMELALKELNESTSAVNQEDIQYLQDECGMELVECNVEAIHEAVVPVREKYMQELEPEVQDIVQKILEM